MRFHTPKNFKNGKFIMNRFRKKDLAIFGIGLVSTILLFYFFIVLILIYKVNPFVILLSLIPAIATGMLVLIPANIKHNLLEAWKIRNEYQRRKKFIQWEGVHHFDRKTNKK